MSQRRFCGHDFEFVADIELKRDLDQEIILGNPEDRYRMASTAKLHRHGQGPFCELSISFEPSVAGAFILTVEDEAAYVGTAEDLQRRINSQIGHISPSDCYSRGQPTNCRLNKLILEEALAGRAVQVWLRRTADPSSLKSELRGGLDLAWGITR